MSKFYINEQDGNVYWMNNSVQMNKLMAAPINDDGTFDTKEGIECYVNTEFTKEQAEEIVGWLK